ncbi:MAG TPA: hypothetical protein VFV84_15955 [Burkholderiales bacterium]|nr:hypothetical protein [Burkholderiales bacterium]
MKTARLALVACIAAAFAAAALASEHHVAMAIGLLPIAWLAMEAAWRLFGAPR